MAMSTNKIGRYTLRGMDRWIRYIIKDTPKKQTRTKFKEEKKIDFKSNLHLIGDQKPLPMKMNH